jgi:serine/threonine protein kinase HipA of HipAB toxin-antitoxin module
MKKSQEEKRIASNLRLKERRAKEKTQEEKDAQRIASNLRLKERRAKIREKIKKDAFKK